MLRLLMVGTAALIIGAAVACTVDESGGPENGTGTAESLEYKLAVVNADGYVSEGDASVAEFQRLLDALSRYCPESRERIADMLVVTNQNIGERGGSESLLETARNLEHILAPPVTELVGNSCADEFALWVVTAAP
jgi:hypothetical protein